jgi:hypothetical protein
MVASTFTLPMLPRSFLLQHIPLRLYCNNLHIFRETGNSVYYMKAFRWLSSLRKPVAWRQPDFFEGKSNLFLIFSQRKYTRNVPSSSEALGMSIES